MDVMLKLWGIRNNQKAVVVALGSEPLSTLASKSQAWHPRSFLKWTHIRRYMSQ
jgi:hypothetical protein